MTVVATKTVIVGGKELQAGDEIPASVTFGGRERQVDADALVEQGLAEKKTAGKKTSSGD